MKTKTRWRCGALGIGCLLCGLVIGGYAAQRTQGPTDGLSCQCDRVVPVTTGAGNDTEAVWSPDGRRIAFQTDAAGDLDIAVVDLASGKVTTLVGGAGQACYPAWTRDGALELSAPMPNLTNLAVRAAGASVVLEGTATPFPSGVTLSIADGVVTELDFAGVVDVDRLVLGGRPRSPGLYGGIESSAPVKPSSAYFSGTGTLNVLYGPAESGSVLMLR